MKLDNCNKILEDFSTLVRDKKSNDYKGRLKVGVDLGTANIVLSVLDEENRPIAGATYPSTVVKDGIVVDYIGATRVVRMLKEQVEDMLGTKLTYAATAIPPGITEGNTKVIANVVESADLEVVNIVDEPTAAAEVLGITDGAVVDVGGGTTGISILKESFEEAEEYKKDKKNENDVFTIVKPVVQKMASIVKKYIQGYDVDNIYVVGGACCFDEFATVFKKEINVDVVKPIEPLLVTPLGIAMNCNV